MLLYYIVLHQAYLVLKCKFHRCGRTYSPVCMTGDICRVLVGSVGWERYRSRSRVDTGVMKWVWFQPSCRVESRQMTTQNTPQGASTETNMYLSTTPITSRSLLHYCNTMSSNCYIRYCNPVIPTMQQSRL